VEEQNALAAIPAHPAGLYGKKRKIQIIVDSLVSPLAVCYCVSCLMQYMKLVAEPNKGSCLLAVRASSSFVEKNKERSGFWLKRIWVLIWEDG